MRMMPDPLRLQTADLQTTVDLLDQLTAQAPEEHRAAMRARLGIYEAFVRSPKYARLPLNAPAAAALKRWILRDWLSRCGVVSVEQQKRVNEMDASNA